VKTVSTTAFKARVVHYLDTVSTSEPLVVQRKETPVAVFISFATYERLLALENRYLVEQAKEGEKSGYIGVDKSMSLLESAVNEKP
jgi:PHD/YefM family antitoxin component YafN of YafNO toxin-antitoxin module